MSVKVKICGITRIEDGLAAAKVGADALGFMFYEQSPRWIPPPSAAAIIRELPPFVVRVGVFVNATEAYVRQVIENCGLDTLQFHGDEGPEFCEKFNLPVLKALRIKDEESLRGITVYRTAAWLLDSYVPGKAGGTGAIFNWDLAVKAKKLGGRIILAGGLTPENVAEAVREVRPYGVDVSSGVESSPGIKDIKKIRRFIEAARGG